MPAYGFGSGSLFGYRTDVAVPQPVQFGALQDVSLDLSFNIKELFGQSQFPLAVARSTAKVTGKAKSARIIASQFNELFFGQTLATGQKTTAVNETGTPTTNSLTVANSAQFVEDLGVFKQSTGAPLTRVASAPAAGQYSVSAGVYTFAAADSNPPVFVSYTYTIAGTGQKLVMSNQLLGAAPQFKCVLAETYQGNKFQVELNACIATKLTIPTKIEDFIIPEFDFSAFVDASGNLGTISFPE